MNLRDLLAVSVEAAVLGGREVKTLFVCFLLQLNEQKVIFTVA